MLLRIAGITIDFNTRYPDYVRSRCSDYLCSGSMEPDICITPSVQDILKANVNGVGPMEAELYAMNIPLCEWLPSHDRLTMHGVALEYNGKSYIFTAESGTGKSTRAFLCQQLLGKDSDGKWRATIINGDKPILWFRNDRVLACGTPWSGKEGLQANRCVPLGGIFLLQRLEDAPSDSIPAASLSYSGNRAVPASRQDTLDFLLDQIYLPVSPAGKVQTLQLIEQLYNTVPVYRLVTDLSPEATQMTVSLFR